MDVLVTRHGSCSQLLTFGTGNGDGPASEAGEQDTMAQEPVKCAGEGAEQHSPSEAQEMGLAGETPLSVYTGE